MSHSIRVLVFEDDGQLVAQCLEYDIGAQAADKETLLSRLDAVIKAEFCESIERHGEPFAGIEPAPAYFQEQWDRVPSEGHDHETPLDDGSVHLEMKRAA